MSKMEKGLVCYFDLLGFSYLTKNITDEENYKILKNNFVLFHKIIYEIIKDPEINTSILSDCVFIYTYNTTKIDILMKYAANIMRNSLKNGILVRGGMCYGDFEVVKTTLSSTNICGEAVTKAVTYEETKGQGCRLFTDENLHCESDLCCNVNVELIKDYRNYQNYDTLDIFEWPFIHNSFCMPELVTSFNSSIPQDVLDLILDNFIIYSHLRYSESYNWNCANENGRRHIAATIEYLTTIQEKIFTLLGLEISLRQNFETYLNKTERKNEYKEAFIDCYKDFIQYLSTTQIKLLQSKNKNLGTIGYTYLNEKLQECFQKRVKTY